MGDLQFRFDAELPYQRAAIDAVLTAATATDPPDQLSIEMETGTGKTYVYLRTIADLHKRYGWSRFVIVVPSVAIREGVLSSARQLREHFKQLYDGLVLSLLSYDGARPHRVREFATGGGLQVLLINIDSFAKDTNLIHRRADILGGHAPLELLQEAEPVVVLDEPQHLETPLRREAVESLKPRLVLRYSATHRSAPNLVYRLTPVDAYDLRLVKRIGVLSVSAADQGPRLMSVNATSRSVTARVSVGGTVQEVRTGSVVVSPGRPDRVVAEIGAVPEVLRFSDGTMLDLEDTYRLQIHAAVETHLEKELQLHALAARGTLGEGAWLKPLTLFFVDRVAHYAPADGVARRLFEAAFTDLAAQPRYADLDLPATADVHDGYFATTARGVPKDVRAGAAGKEETAAFERIMRSKERLLTFAEPLRFIFSHSALSEGWDNPNVFTICHLQSGSSELRRRQQVGRGLRLPVLTDGTRCHLPEVNILTVVAGESFSVFAAGLQRDIEKETGVSFSGRIERFAKPREAAPAVAQKIPSTPKPFAFDTDDLIDAAVVRIEAVLAEPATSMRRGELTMLELTEQGIAGGVTREVPQDQHNALSGGALTVRLVPYLCDTLPLARSTIVRIVNRTGLTTAPVTVAAQLTQACRTVLCQFTEPRELSER